MSSKPIKKTDKELFSLIDEKIKQGSYVFLPHSKKRLNERNISELDVIRLLSGEKVMDGNATRKRIHMRIRRLVIWHKTGSTALKAMILMALA